MAPVQDRKIESHDLFPGIEQARKTIFATYDFSRFNAVEFNALFPGVEYVSYAVSTPSYDYLVPGSHHEWKKIADISTIIEFCSPQYKPLFHTIQDLIANDNAENKLAPREIVDRNIRAYIAEHYTENYKTSGFWLGLNLMGWLTPFFRANDGLIRGQLDDAKERSASLRAELNNSVFNNEVFPETYFDKCAPKDLSSLQDLFSEAQGLVTSVRDMKPTSEAGLETKAKFYEAAIGHCEKFVRKAEDLFMKSQIAQFVVN